MSPLPSAFLQELSTLFPADFASSDPSDLEEYGKDWTRVVAPAPSLVVFPRSTAEVSTLMKLCARHGVAVVPSGGRTGLAGGAVAARGEVVVSTGRMREMGPVDEIGNTVTVQAGVITEAVHHHCAPHGLLWPVDFASKGSSTVGGNIATNAGGVKVIRYGLTRNWVLGLKVVLANGDILELNGALEKNNTGVDLRQLFIGSEGTLGIVTEATLKLTRLPGKLDVMLFAVPDLAGVLQLFREARRGPFTVMAYEFFTDVCVERQRRHRPVRMPFDTESSHYVLLEVEKADPDALEAWVAELFDEGRVLDGVLAAHAQQAAELWMLREGISESLSATGLPHKNDIALPIAALADFSREFEALIAEEYPSFELAIFGHIGDGNLHVNVMKPDGMEREAFFQQVHELDRKMFDRVRSHGGSVSAEHGIGLLKKDWLPWSRSPEELAVLRALKTALDPEGRLNPGKIFD